MSDMIVCSGWLHKKRNEEKRTLLGPVGKYQKRWFELTEDALAYAKDPNELVSSKIEVFNLWDMAWIKRVDQLKIQMKFPSRVLCVKAESPGEADKWHYEIERLTHQQGQQQVQEPASPPPAQAKKAPQIATAFTIEADSDSDGERASSGRSSNRRKAGRTESQRRQQQQQQRGTGSAFGMDPPRLTPLRVTPPPEQSHAAQASDRPPSPRSLLANPRLGTMIVSTPTTRTAEEASEVQLFSNTSDEQPQTPQADAAAAAAAADAAPVELPRPAILNTSLRSKVAIQDEVAPTLQPMASSGTASPLNSSLRGPGPGFNSSLQQQQPPGSPLNSSLRGSAQQGAGSPLNSSLRSSTLQQHPSTGGAAGGASLNSSLRAGTSPSPAGSLMGSLSKQRRPPPQEEVLAFDPHEVAALPPPAYGATVAARLKPPASSVGSSRNSSRPGTENGIVLQAARAGPRRPDDERLELDGPPAAVSGTAPRNLNSAGSSQGAGLVAGTRPQSVASNGAGGAGHIASGTATHGEASNQQGFVQENWDSSEDEADDEGRDAGQTKAAGARTQQHQHQQHQHSQQQQHQPRQHRLQGEPVGRQAPHQEPESQHPPGPAAAAPRRVVKCVAKAKPKAAAAAPAPVAAAAARATSTPDQVMGNSWDEETDDGASPAAAQHKAGAQVFAAPGRGGGAPAPGTGLGGAQQATAARSAAQQGNNDWDDWDEDEE